MVNVGRAEQVFLQKTATDSSVSAALNRVKQGNLNQQDAQEVKSAWLKDVMGIAEGQSLNSEQSRELDDKAGRFLADLSDGALDGQFAEQALETAKKLLAHDQPALRISFPQAQPTCDETNFGWPGAQSDIVSGAELKDGDRLAVAYDTLTDPMDQNRTYIPEREKLKSLIEQFKVDLGQSYPAWKASAAKVNTADEAKILIQRVMDTAYEARRPKTFLGGPPQQIIADWQALIHQSKEAVFDASAGYGMAGVFVAGSVATVIDVAVPTELWDLAPGGKVASSARKVLREGLERGEKFVRLKLSQTEWNSFVKNMLEHSKPLPNGLTKASVKALDEINQIGFKIANLEQKLISPAFVQGLLEIGPKGKEFYEKLVKDFAEEAAKLGKGPLSAEGIKKAQTSLGALMGGIREGEVGIALHRLGKKQGFVVDSFNIKKGGSELADIVLRDRKGAITLVQVKSGNAGNLTYSHGAYREIVKQIESTFATAQKIDVRNGVITQLGPGVSPAQKPRVMFCFDTISPDVERKIMEISNRTGNQNVIFGPNDIIINSNLLRLPE